MKHISFTISFGADHGGLDLKKSIIEFCKEKGHIIIDHGTHSYQSVDYPDYASKVTNDIISEKASLGILICTTGIGMSIAANKVKGIRAAVLQIEDDAEFSKKHNNINVLCFGGRHTTDYIACRLLDIFLNTPYDGGRHETRIQKITAIENCCSL